MATQTEAAILLADTIGEERLIKVPRELITNEIAHQILQRHRVIKEEMSKSDRTQSDLTRRLFRLREVVMEFVSFWYLGPSDDGHLARAIHDEIQRECVSMDASKVSAKERAHYVRCWRNMLWSQRAPGGWYTCFDGETERLSVAMVKLQIEADESFCLYEAAKLAEAYADSAGFVEHRLRIGPKYFKSEVSAVEAALVDMLLLRRDVRQEVGDFIEYKESDDFIREKEADNIVMTMMMILLKYRPIRRWRWSEKKL